MANLAKKLRKLLKHRRNIAMIEPTPEFLEEMSEQFDTIFVFSEQPPLIRKRNIIYRLDYNDTAIASDISMIHITTEHLDKLSNCLVLINKSKPAIMIDNPNPLGKKSTRWLENVSYEIKELAKHWQMWKPR
jgi:hypothetical protein